MYCYHRLNRLPQPHMPRPRHEDDEPMAVWQRFTSHKDKISRYVCIKDFISKWFWRMPVEQLTKANIGDLLAYGFLYKSREQLEAEGQGHLPDTMVSELEEAWDVRFNDGPYVKRSFMCHQWKPVRCHYRPLAFYAAIEYLIALKHVLMLAMGFAHAHHRGMAVYTYGEVGRAGPRDALSSVDGETVVAMAAEESMPPFMFLHGVGVGVLPYINFVQRLAATGRPLIVPEVRHLSMRMCSEVIEVDTVVDSLVEWMDARCVDKAHVVAHSYGTFTASRLSQRFRGRLASLTLLDPVCFLMFTGKLIYNFVYRQPCLGAKLLMWFIARHQAHAASVARSFYWTLLNLWCDQLPSHTLVVLAGQDELVPSDEVMSMLQHESRAHLMYHPTHAHADFLIDLPWQAQIAEQVAQMAEIASGVAASPRGFRVSVAKGQKAAAAAGLLGRSDSASSYDTFRRLSLAGLMGFRGPAK